MEKQPNLLLTILTFAGTPLAFPLIEVVSIQQVKQATIPNQALPYLLGTIQHAKRNWPIFSLNQDLTVVTQIPATYPYLVCFSSPNTQTGLCLSCETISSLILTTPIQFIPDYAKLASSPLQQWCYHNQTLLALTNTTAIALYISHEIERHSS